MKISEIYRRIERYLRSDDTRLRIVNFQDRASLIAFREHFNVGTAVFKSPSDFSKDDEDLLTENLYAEIQSFQGNLFLIGFTSQLRLKGRDALRQFIAQLAHTTLKSGKLILICFGCAEILHFDDTRIQGLVYSADDATSALPQLRFVGDGITIPKGQTVSKGIDKVGLLIETVNADTLVIRTNKLARDYPGSMLHIEELVDAYAALCNIDQATKGLDKTLGKTDQWAFALKEISSEGSWSSLVTHLFGSPYALDLAIGQWDRYTEDMQWMYFIALKLFGSTKNRCLNQAVGRATSPKDMVRKIYRSILGESCQSPTFINHYRERKQLLQQMFDVEDDAEVIDYIKMTKQHKRDAIRYLTNNTKLEKEAIIDLISVYAEEYTSQELRDILVEIYPDLAAYLDSYSFYGNTWLDAYFTEYRYSKVLNRISPELREMAERQAVDHDFLKLLPRIAAVDSISKDGTFLFFVDAMGVEFIPYIVEKCREYELKVTVTVAHCELPSLTRCNKDFFESYPPEQRTKVSELDDIIHHGKENYDYQVTKTPLHLIRELEIIDEVLRNARTRLLSGNSTTKVLLVADHGATRMAVINEHIIDIDVNSKGTNGGRVCEYTEAVKTIPYAIREGDYYILASYDRFKGGQPANVEAHGGGTLEEVIVPVITLSMPTEEIEVQVETKIVEYSFKQQPVLKLFSKTVLTNVSVLINGKWYKVDESIDGQNFSFTLTGLKKGQYIAALYADGNEVTTGLTFELRSKAGSSTGKAGIL